MAVIPVSRLLIRKREHIDGDHHAHDRNVFCPFNAESRALAACLACPRFATVSEDGAALICHAAPVTSSCVDNEPLCVGPAAIGAHVPVGAILEATVISATGRTTIAMVAQRAVEHDVRGVVVVDDELRPIGFVSRHDVVTATRYRSIVTLSEQAHEEATLDERAPLSEAIERMVHERRRVFVTVDATGRAAGVLSDLDILRWCTRARTNGKALAR